MARNIDPINIKITAQNDDLLFKLNKSGERIKKMSQKADKDLKKTSKGFNQAGEASQKMGAGFKRAANSAAILTGPLNGISGRLSFIASGLSSMGIAAVSASAGFAAITTVLAKGIMAAAKYESEMGRISAVLNSTGMAAGLTAQQVDELAQSIARASLASVQEVRDASVALLTFKTVVGDTFERAITLSQDLSVALGSDIKGAALQLGKALEDPIKGLTALTRSGVSFSVAESDLIKKLVRSGQLLEAQGVILDKVAGQVGGAGKGENVGLVGSVDSLSESWDNMLINIGKTKEIGGFVGLIISKLDAEFRKMSGTVGLTLPEKMELLNSKLINTNQYIEKLKKSLGEGNTSQFLEKKIAEAQSYQDEMDSLTQEEEARAARKIAAEKLVSDNAAAQAKLRAELITSSEAAKNQEIRMETYKLSGDIAKAEEIRVKIAKDAAAAQIKEWETAGLLKAEAEELYNQKIQLIDEQSKQRMKKLVSDQLSLQADKLDQQEIAELNSEGKFIEVEERKLLAVKAAIDAELLALEEKGIKSEEIQTLFNERKIQAESETAAAIAKLQADAAPSIDLPPVPEGDESDFNPYGMFNGDASQTALDIWTTFLNEKSLISAAFAQSDIDAERETQQQIMDIKLQYRNDLNALNLEYEELAKEAKTTQQKEELKTEFDNDVAKLKNTRDLGIKKANFDGKMKKDEATRTKNFMKAGFNELVKNNKAAFRIKQAYDIAEAVQNTYGAAIGAYKAMVGIPIVGPALAVAASSAALIFGAMQVKSIASAKPGGSASVGGGSAPSAPSIPSPSAPAFDDPEETAFEPVAREVNLFVDGSIDPSGTRRILEAVNEQLGDGVNLNVEFGT